MISIVIVSHSLKLAEGLLELASQVAQSKVTITIAAGIDDPENPIGTDAIAVMEAIEQVYSEDGVLVFVDLGSAILSAETALDLMEPIQRKVVHICAAPLIEGCIAACVSAAAGLSLEAVVRDANNAVAAKYQALGQQLQPVEPEPETVAEHLTHEEPLTFSWTVHHPHGLHIRPAAVLVAALRPFEAQIWLEKAGKTVDAKSINNLLSLGIQHGDTLTFTALGHDARQAINTLENQAEKLFGANKEK